MNSQYIMNEDGDLFLSRINNIGGKRIFSNII